MRIIAGKYKNRAIPTTKKFDYRPSTAKFREALFSILESGEFLQTQPLEGAKILDLFAGSGALAFEALSRGANFATLVDKSDEHLKMAENFAGKIGVDGNMEFLRMDVNFLHLSQKYDVVFIDAPYYKKMVAKTLQILISQEYLMAGAIIIVEVEKQEQITDINNLKLMKEKIYGRSKLLIFKYE